MPPRTKNPGFNAQMMKRGQEIDTTDWHWKRLNSDQKKFLGMYVRFRDAKRAAMEAGVTLAWVHQQEKDLPYFKEVTEQVVDHPFEFARMLAIDALPQSILILVELMETAKDEKLRLDAIKHLHHVVRLTDGETGATNKFLQMNNINLFRVDNYKPTITANTEVKNLVDFLDSDDES
jgi:hypothetical protein